MQPTLTPAYGRDYKSKADVLAGLNGGHDFICNPSGGYIDITGITDAGWQGITVRYQKMTKVVIVNVADGWAK